MGRTRVSYVSQWFPPEAVAAPVWIADALRDRGLEVRVVTGVPHYPTGSPIAGYAASDWRLNDSAGYRVLRVPEYPSHDNSSLKRAATFGSFAVSGAFLASRAIGMGDVSLVYSSPATAALPALTARLRYGTPYVLMVQDLWPDSIFATGFMGSSAARALIEPAASVFVDTCYKMAEHICVITPGMRRRLIARGVPAGKVSVVFNWVDEDTVRPGVSTGRLHSELKLPERAFIALYAGNIGEAQALQSWVCALGLLEDAADIHLVFVGSGTQERSLRELADNLSVGGRVHLLPPVPISDIPSLVAEAQVSVVSLANAPIFGITIPSKVQSSLAMASPLIASCRGDVAEVVHDSGAGWVAAPEDPVSIARALLKAASAEEAELCARGASGRKYYVDHMARDIGSEVLATALRRAASERAMSGRSSVRLLASE